MNQPVKLSDALVLDAWLAGEALERSIAGQVEFWARLGRAIEPLLHGTQVLALSRSGSARPLSACLDSVDSPEGRRRIAQFLQTQLHPHYEPAPDSPGLLVRIEAEGRRALGRFVSRRFKAVKAKPRKRRACRWTSGPSSLLWPDRTAPARPPSSTRTFNLPGYASSTARHSGEGENDPSAIASAQVEALWLLAEHETWLVFDRSPPNGPIRQD